MPAYTLEAVFICWSVVSQAVSMTCVTASTMDRSAPAAIATQAPQDTSEVALLLFFCQQTSSSTNFADLETLAGLGIHTLVLVGCEEEAVYRAGGWDGQATGLEWSAGCCSGDAEDGD